MAYLGTVKQGLPMRKPIRKVSDKLATVNENFTINMYDNGYMLEIGGRGYAHEHEDAEWAGAKIIVSTVEDLCDLIKEVTQLPRDSD